MPINYEDYPKNWKWLSRQIVKDAGNRCELCYAPNGERVVRTPDGPYPWRPASPDDWKPVKIVLTVHHIDGNKQNSAKQNLISLCQKCHLRLDLHKHMINRTREK